jgi:hypothetical protein
MADLHNISIAKVYLLNALEFLNWWAYLTEKTAYEISKIKK